jgi:hypothetical protein
MANAFFSYSLSQGLGKQNVSFQSAAPKLDVLEDYKIRKPPVSQE